MRVKHTNKPLPRDWSGLSCAKEALLIADVAVTRWSRLRMKLLVFPSKAAILRFGRKLGRYRFAADRRAEGYILYLQHTHTYDGETEPHMIEVDPYYFAAMVLCVPHLTMEVICHESVHAAQAYCARNRNSGFWPESKRNPDELVAYPAGRIASEVDRVIAGRGLYKE